MFKTASSKFLNNKKFSFFYSKNNNNSNNKVKSADRKLPKHNLGFQETFLFIFLRVFRFLAESFQKILKLGMKTFLLEREKMRKNTVYNTKNTKLTFA